MRYKLDHFGIDQAEKWSHELEAVLRELGISIAAGSELERVCLAPTEILSYRPGDGLTSAETNRQYLDTAALAELATRLVAARNHPSFATLLPHLELLDHGDPRQAGRARPTDDSARKLFEMFTALLAMRFSDNVELAHPLHGSPDNPDVVLRYQGRKWGLACKVPISENPESLVQNLAKAVQQVVASGVDAGFPMFNLKNVIAPESYWRVDSEDLSGRSFRIVPEPRDLLRRALADVKALWRGVESRVGAEAFANVLSPRPCVPAVLSYLHVLAPVFHGTFTAPTTSKFVSCYHIRQHLPSDKVLADAMHASAIAA
jgi:hypothetical protein